MIDRSVPLLINTAGENAPGRGSAIVLNDSARLADVAGRELSSEIQNALLSGIEARLTQEVHGLAVALQQFGLRTKAIREEIPSSANFCKLVAGFFPLVAFQLADAILRAPQGFTFEDDGALYLKQLGLELQDFVRELDLEGRKFLAVAFLDKRGCDVLDRTPDGDEL